MNVPRLVDAKELAARLGVSTKLIYDQAAAGTIPCYRLGRAIRFDIEAVFKTLAASS